MKQDMDVVREFSSKIYYMHCWYCGVETKKGGGRRKGLKNEDLNAYFHIRTKDHLIARSAGGGKNTNLVPSCLHCNVLKASVTVEEFRIMFFGIHSGKFWGEQLAESIKSGTQLKLDVIELNNTTGCIEKYERDINRKKQKQKEALNEKSSRT